MLFSLKIFKKNLNKIHAHIQNAAIWLDTDSQVHNWSEWVQVCVQHVSINKKGVEYIT